MTRHHDADDDTVDRNDTCEDDRKDTLHDDLRLHDTERGDTKRRLGDTVGRAKVGQAHGESDTESAEEGRVGGAEIVVLRGRRGGVKEHRKCVHLCLQSHNKKRKHWFH